MYILGRTPSTVKPKRSILVPWKTLRPYPFMPVRTWLTGMIGGGDVSEGGDDLAAGRGAPKAALPARTAANVRANRANLIGTDLSSSSSRYRCGSVDV